MVKPDEELIPTRASLLERLRNWQDQSSWQDFFDIYWKLIYGTARKAGLTEAEAQDVVQETLVSTAKHMPTFQYDPRIGSFKAWLLNMTRWRIIEQFRKRRTSASHVSVPLNDTSTGNLGGIENLPDPTANLDEVWAAEWEKSLLDAAIAKVKRNIDPQKYQLFDLYANKGLPAAQVAETFGISIDQVYLAKHRVTEQVKAEVRRLEKEMT